MEAAVSARLRLAGAVGAASFPLACPGGHSSASCWGLGLLSATLKDGRQAGILQIEKQDSGLAEIILDTIFSLLAALLGSTLTRNGLNYLLVLKSRQERRKAYADHKTLAIVLGELTLVI